MRLVLEKWHLAFAALIFACGVVASVHAVGVATRSFAEIEKSRALLTRISMLEEKLKSVERAKANLGSLPGGVPEDLDAVISDMDLDDAVLDSVSHVEALGEGWSVVTWEISFNDVLLSNIDRFAVNCSAMSPPWVVTEISLQSSPFESGRGRAIVKLQALRRKTR